MSTVLWANVLVGTTVMSEQADRYALYAHLDKLGALTRQLGLPAFDDFCDTTDLRYNTDESMELPEGMTSTDDLMARDGAWLEAPQAKDVLERLLGHIRDHKVRFGLFSNAHDDVVTELTEVLDFLRSQEGEATRFNFSVVM